MRIFKGIKCDQEPISATISSKAGKQKDGVITFDVELRCKMSAQQSQLNASASLIFSESLPSPHGPESSEYSEGRIFPYTISEVYDKILFHGKDLQGLKKISYFSESGISAQVASAPSPDAWLKKPLRPSWVSDPLVIDAAFQLASIWCYTERGAVSLPTFVKTYRQFVSNFPSSGITIKLEVQQVTKNKLTGTFLFIDDQNCIIAVLSGYEAIIDPSLYKAFKPQYAKD